MSVSQVRLLDETYRLREGGSADTARRVYRVDFDAVYDADAAAVADDGTLAIPTYLDAFSPTRPAVRVREVDVDRIDPRAAVVTVDYAVSTDTADGEEERAATASDAIALPPQISYGGSLEVEPYFRDVDGLLSTTSAGEELADLPTRVAPTGTIQIVRNVATFVDGEAEQVRATVNSSPESIGGTLYPEATLRVDLIAAESQTAADGSAYFRRTVRLAKRITTWDDRWEDRGLYQLDAAGHLVEILDAAGVAVKTPFPLDGLGVAAASPTTIPAEIVRRPYRRASLSFWV